LHHGPQPSYLGLQLSDLLTLVGDREVSRYQLAHRFGIHPKSFINANDSKVPYFPGHVSLEEPAQQLIAAAVAGTGARPS
jgi:hypothetical protein